MASEAKRKANAKYKANVKRIMLEFTPSELKLWEYVKAQPKQQTYIKDLIRADMEKK